MNGHIAFDCIIDDDKNPIDHGEIKWARWNEANERKTEQRCYKRVAMRIHYQYTENIYFANNQNTNSWITWQRGRAFPPDNAQNGQQAKGK